jgi:cation diffusion facilitator family transporter
VGRQTRNAAIQALAFDHRNDAIAALAVSLGILLGRSGLPWVDPLAGAIVSVIILRTGIEILRASSQELMGAVPGQYLSGRIQSLLASIPAVEQIEEIHAHRFGPYLVINLTIGIEGSLTVAEGDRIASQVEERLLREIEYLSQVHIHYHPSERATPAQRPQLTIGSDRTQTR